MEEYIGKINSIIQRYKELYAKYDGITESIDGMKLKIAELEIEQKEIAVSLGLLRMEETELLHDIRSNDPKTYADIMCSISNLKI
jgi:hypothetical protein